MSRLARIVLGTFALLVPACGSIQPLGPTPLDEGVILYIHAGFSGSSQQVNRDISNLGSAEGPCIVADESGATGTWNDCVSSIRVLPGWQATLYRDDNFRGTSLSVTEDVDDLRSRSGPCDRSFNDCISSIRVSRR